MVSDYSFKFSQPCDKFIEDVKHLLERGKDLGSNPIVTCFCKLDFMCFFGLSCICLFCRLHARSPLFFQVLAFFTLAISKGIAIGFLKFFSVNDFVHRTHLDSWYLGSC